MKELTTPNNDWFSTARPLPFGQLEPNATLKTILASSVDGARLAEAVAAGMRKLYGSAQFREFRSTISLQEQLRSLFCPVELNLESDTAAFDDNKTLVTMPTAFLVDLRLAQGTVAIPRPHYEAALRKAGSQFPKTSRIDADHAWLAPVKAASDVLAIEMLMQQKQIDAEFVADVLAVDFTNPVFSHRRCSLLSSVPDSAGPDWLNTFTASLKARTDSAAKDLLKNLTDTERTAGFHRASAAQFLKKCESNLQSPGAVSDIVRVLGQNRARVFESEISKNRKGQILEPGNRPGQLTDDGFKLVFPVIPEMRPFVARPELLMTETCTVVEVP
jgi:hypothetical protein